MRSKVFIPLCLLLAMAGCSSPRAIERRNSGPSIDYHVEITDETPPRFAISAELQGIAGDTIVFDFPMWGPGAYDIVNFGSYVDDFEAESADGRKLAAFRRDSNSFAIVGADSFATLRYHVRSSRDARSSLWFCLADIGSDYAFANTVALFGYPEGYKDIPYQVSYDAPSGWDIATALDPAGHGVYRARDYDELVDAPVEMGIFQRLEFVVGEKPHTIVLRTFQTGDTVDVHPIADTAARIVDMLTGFFGDMPYDRYLFQINLGGFTNPLMRGISGALEHRNSSTYLVTHAPGRPAASELKDVITHEFFHLWSPKRIHVGTLGPFDYQHPPHTSSLWFAEGVTEYYAITLPSRNGMIGEQELLRRMHEKIEPFYHRAQQRPITALSAGISSASSNESMQLYSKGPLLGLLLDIEIRTQSNDARSLDDAMRYFNAEYGRKGRTFTDEEIIPIIERATGTHLGGFYGRYIGGIEPLPIDDHLEAVGLKMAGETRMKRTMGATTTQDREGITVVSVAPGGSADRAGLHPGDLIRQIIIEGHATSAGSFPSSYEDILPNLEGEDVKFIVARAGELLTIPGVFTEEPVEVYHLAPDPGASGQARRMRKEIFGF
jgi:predicted metalloprotease with PDZ domain